MMVSNSNKTALSSVSRELLIGIFLAVAVLIVYWQAQGHDFVVYDDGLYVTANSRVQAGLSIENIRWAFSSISASNWHPLTWLSHMLDVQLYGMDPGAHHRTSIIFHILNTLLLFLVFKRMTGKLACSALVAGLFALHPLHVESVAWVAERKDVLSTFFWMLTLYAYAWYADQPGIKRYSLVLLFFILGLMSKPMLVTLPFVLLLLDFWPLKRFRLSPLFDGEGDPCQRRTVFNLIGEKIPLMVLSAASSMVTFMVQQIGGSVAPLEKLSLADRLANAAVSFVRYIVKMIWPADLAVFYPRPASLPGWQVAASCAFLAAICLLAIWSLKKRPWFAVGWLWYVGTLVPVIGLVQVGLQAMADRYTYVPLIGLFIICAWGAAELFERWPYRPILGSIAAVITFAGLMIVSWSQAAYWSSSTTLFKHALNVTNNNFLAHNALGNALTMQGKIDEAVWQYDQALSIRPEYYNAHYNLGHALSIQKKHPQAVQSFRRALQFKPDYAEAHVYLGHEMALAGQRDEAIKHFRQAILIRPDYAEAHDNLGFQLARRNETKAAIAHFHKALQYRPGYARAHFNLGSVLVQQQQLQDAIRHFGESIRLKPDYAEAYNEIAQILVQQGKYDQAILLFKKALKLKPGYTTASTNLAKIIQHSKTTD